MAFVLDSANSTPSQAVGWWIASDPGVAQSVVKLALHEGLQGDRVEAPVRREQGLDYGIEL